MVEQDGQRRDKGAGRKDEEDDWSSLELKRMLTNHIHVLEPRVCTDKNVTNGTETDEVICERPTAPATVLRQPIMSDIFSNVNGGGRVESYLCERTHGISMVLETTDLPPGRNAVDTAGGEIKGKGT